MRIDAHQHFWNYDPIRDSWITPEMGAIRNDFLPIDLSPQLDSCKIDGTIAVQADQSEQETEFLLGLAQEFDFVRGVVGWLDLKSSSLTEKLEHFSQFDRLKGFRHVVQGEPKGFLSDKAFINGVNNLAGHNFSYDLLIYHHQLDEAIEFVRNVNEVLVIVDHLAKPSIATQEINTWSKGINALADFENVYCKISGMVTEAKWKKWKKSDFAPYIDTVLESFGVKRILYGSDWPVCLLSATYEEQAAIVEDHISTLNQNEIDDIMGNNAERVYKL